MRASPLAVFRRLDRYLLLNQPVLWLTRLHWVLLMGGAGGLMLAAIACTVDVSVQTVHRLDRLFRVVFIFGGTLSVAWAMLHTRSIQEFRRLAPRLGVYLVLSYVVVAVTPVVWARGFVQILELRLAKGVSWREIDADSREVDRITDEVHSSRASLGDLSVLYREFIDANPGAEWETFLSQWAARDPERERWLRELPANLERLAVLDRKYGGTGGMPGDPSGFRSLLQSGEVVLNMQTTMRKLSSATGQSGYYPIDDLSYGPSAALIIGGVAFSILLLLWPLVIIDSRTLAAATLGPVLVGVAILSIADQPFRHDPENQVLVGSMVALLLVAGSVALALAMVPRRRSVAAGAGISFLVALLPWCTTLFGFACGLEVEHILTLTRIWLVGAALLLLALAPAIQRRLIALGSKPR